MCLFRRKSGALYFSATGFNDVKIINSIFRGNEATAKGAAAISIDGGTLGLYYNLYDANTGRQGGALLIRNAQVMSECSIYRSNRSTSSGGAIFQINSKSFFCQDLFLENRAGPLVS